MLPQPRKLRKTRTGKVVSTKAVKTITVAIERKVKHPLYGKFIRKTAKLLAHDPEEVCQVGETVEIIETRPLSKRKCWRLLKKITPKQA